MHGHEWGKGAEGEREYSSRLPTECRAWCGAQSHNPEILPWAKIKTLNQLSHPGAPLLYLFCLMFFIWLFNLFGVHLLVQDMAWVNKVSLQMDSYLSPCHWSTSSCSDTPTSWYIKFCFLYRPLPELDLITPPESIPRLLCVFPLKNFKIMLWSSSTPQKLDSNGDFLLPCEELIFAIKFFIPNHEYCLYFRYLLSLVRLCGFMTYVPCFSSPMYSKAFYFYFGYH